MKVCKDKIGFEKTQVSGSELGPEKLWDKREREIKSNLNLFTFINEV